MNHAYANLEKVCHLQMYYQLYWGELCLYCLTGQQCLSYWFPHTTVTCETW